MPRFSGIQTQYGSYYAPHVFSLSVVLSTLHKIMQELRLEHACKHTRSTWQHNIAGYLATSKQTADTLSILVDTTAIWLTDHCFQ